MEKLFLREVVKEDVDLLFHWANDELVRKNAFHTEQIPYETHVKWFDRVLADDSVLHYILMNETVPVGQIRVNVETDSTGEIDYSIAKEYRGQGFGKIICKLLVEELKANHKDITELIAKVKPKNISSSACFIKNGFEEKYVQYELKLKDE